MGSSGGGQGDGVIDFQLAATGKVFRNDGIIFFLAKFVRVLGQGGEKSERIVETEHIQFAGGKFGRQPIEKETDFAVGADSLDPCRGKGEGFGLGVEGFESASDEIGGGRDEEVGLNAFPNPLIHGGTKAVDHDGNADGHGDSDGEGGGGEAVAMKSTGKSGASEDGGGERQSWQKGEKTPEWRGEKGGGEKNAEGGEKAGPRNSSIEGGGGENKSKDEASESGAEKWVGG